MDLNQLNCFIAVAQYLNFTEAAKSLYLSQSAISHSIARLEGELGASLFYRTKNSVSLTSAGEVLLRDAFRVTSILRDSATKIQTMSTGSVGELRVGYVFEPIAERLLQGFKNFYDKYPNVNVIYNIFNSITVARLLENNGIDVGFARPVTIGKHRDINWKHVYRDPLFVAMSVKHELANEKSLTLDAIAQEILILMNRNVNPGMFDMIHHLYMMKGYTPKANDSSNDIFTSIMMARIGIGITILPGQFKPLITDDLRFIPVDDENAYHDIGVAWNKHNTNPALPPFLEELGVL